MITKKDLDDVIAKLTDLALAHNIPRRYSIEHGSGTQGTSYEMSVYYPNFTHPVMIRLGKTRVEALKFLSGYLAAQQELALVVRQKAAAPAGSLSQRWLTPEPKQELTEGDRTFGSLV